jgi:hypothetical protein
MPRFRVSVVLTVTARDATHAYNTVAHSSITSLEIPGLLRIAVHEAVPRPTCRRLRKRTMVRATAAPYTSHCPDPSHAEPEDGKETPHV